MEDTTSRKLVLYQRECMVFDHSIGFALRYSDSDSSNFHREIFALTTGGNHSYLVVRDLDNRIVASLGVIIFDNLDGLNKKIYLGARDLAQNTASEQGLKLVDETGLEHLVEKTSPNQNGEKHSSSQAGEYESTQ